MIRINLLPVKDVQRAIALRQQLSVALLGFFLTLLVMIIPYMLQGRTSRRLDADIEQLRAQITKFDAQTQEVRDLDRKRKELEAKLKVIDDLNQKRVGPVRVLEDLSSAAPEKLWLVDFTEVKAQATITGIALDNQTIAVFMRQLQASKYFFEVDLVETSQSEAVRGVANNTAVSGFKRFIIKAHLDYLGAGGKAEAPPSGTPPAAGKTGT
ncbi:MAG: PilN domain-containing protein [Candidatus Binatia bacterium]|jgi:type IV pilus assembly protein PilN